MRNQVEVTALDRRFKKLERGLRRTAIQTLNFLKQEGKRLEVYLIGSARIRRLNRQYRARDASTSSLAFEFPRGFPQAGSTYRLLGEIYLCPPVIRKRGESIDLLLVHGLLHLLGFNHRKESDRIQMERIENEIRQWLNR